MQPSTPQEIEKNNKFEPKKYQCFLEITLTD